MNESKQCECSMSISVLGDGCRYCQPQGYIDTLHEGIEDDRSELDKANARIAQLEGYLNQLIVIIPDAFVVAQNTISHALAESSDTWLSEHDKAVEVKVLETFAKKIDERGNPDRTLGDDILDMLKARK